MRSQAMCGKTLYNGLVNLSKESGDFVDPSGHFKGFQRYDEWRNLLWKNFGSYKTSKRGKEWIFASEFAEVKLFIEALTFLLTVLEKKGQKESELAIGVMEALERLKRDFPKIMTNLNSVKEPKSNEAVPGVEKLALNNDVGNETVLMEHPENKEELGENKEELGENEIDLSKVSDAAFAKEFLRRYGSPTLATLVRIS